MSLETAKTDIVQVCPQCMSTMVETTTMGVIALGGEGPDMRNTASCTACGWSGKVGELASVPFKNPFGDGTATVEAFGRDVLTVTVQECIEPWGKLLIRWGFMDGTKIDKKKFVSYLTAVAKAATLAIIAERVKQEKAS